MERMEVEKLIEIVHVHPVLYDTNHVDYMRSKMKDELWEKIGAELQKDGKAAKEQWRKLRECHREAMRRQKKRRSGDGAERQKTWTYQSQMEFLLPFMKNRLTQSNLHKSSHSSIPPTVDEDFENTAEEDAILPSPSNEKTRSEIIEDEIPRKKAKNRGEQLSVQQFIQSSERIDRDELRQQIFEKQQQSQDYQNDALYQFFLSMYNTTKGLSGRYQRQVRNKVYEAVAQAEEQYEYEISPDDAFYFSHGSTSCSSAN